MDKHTDRWEWLLVLAGTRQYATPHAHIYVWAEGEIPREAFQPVVQRFIESCDYAPTDGHGNPAQGGTVRIRGTEQTDTIPRTENCGSAGATYTLAQLAHLPDVDSMEFDRMLWASTVRASEGIRHFRKSRYDVWEGEEPEPEDFSPNTVLSEASDSINSESRFSFTASPNVSTDESRFILINDILSSSVRLSPWILSLE